MSRARGERGFSLVEMLIVLCILSILARVALPAYVAMQRNARATRAAGDVNVVRTAAFAQYAATGSFPADGATGVVPVDMKRYLPGGFSFQRKDYTLDWESWVASDSLLQTTGRVVAVTVIVPEPQLGLTILQMLGANCTHWTAGDAHTFVIESTLDAPH